MNADKLTQWILEPLEWYFKEQEELNNNYEQIT